MTPGGPGHLHTRLRPAPPPGPGPASRGGAPLAQPGAAGGGGLGGTCTGSVALRRAPHPPPGCWQPGDGLARPSPYPPGSFHGSAAILRPFLEQSPAAGTGPARREPRGGRVRRGAPGSRGGGRASFPSPGGTQGRTPVLPPGQLCHFRGPGPPPPRSPALQVCSPPGQAPGPPSAAQPPARPVGAGEGRGAGKVAELPCTLRSCS